MMTVATRNEKSHRQRIRLWWHMKYIIDCCFKRTPVVHNSLFCLSLWFFFWFYRISKIQPNLARRKICLVKWQWVIIQQLWNRHGMPGGTSKWVFLKIFSRFFALIDLVSLLSRSVSFIGLFYTTRGSQRPTNLCDCDSTSQCDRFIAFGSRFNQFSARCIGKKNALLFALLAVVCMFTFSIFFYRFGGVAWKAMMCCGFLVVIMLALPRNVLWRRKFGATRRKRFGAIFEKPRNVSLRVCFSMG